VKEREREGVTDEQSGESKEEEVIDEEIGESEMEELVPECDRLHESNASVICHEKCISPTV